MYIYKYIYPQQKIDGENRPMCSKAQITGYGLADERVGYDAVIQAIGI